LSTPRKPLFERLPEIYRIRDTEQKPPGQLEALVGVMDKVHSGIRDNIEALYYDHFIEHCADWVIPYIADLLGTTHLSGDPWTLRADIARTIHHRRRKGTLGSIESLTFTLTGWAVHAVEMRERLLWNQHLNHQRPDAGGKPPLTFRKSISDAVRGGTVTLRDPALLSLADGPFDPFAHVVDLKPPLNGRFGYNIPDLAIFLWRLQDYTVPVSRPGTQKKTKLTPLKAGDAAWSVCFDIHQLGQPMVLFNTYRFTADDEPPTLSHIDAVPGPMPQARLTSDTPAGRPENYIEVQPYAVVPPGDPHSVGLVLHIPQAPFTTTQWKFRGANLCAWAAGLNPSLREYEIVVDPVRGRVMFGVKDETNEADPLLNGLFVSATYGFSGPTGAHPVARTASPANWLGQPAVKIDVNYHILSTGLRDALANLSTPNPPLIIEIHDSMVHELDLSTVVGVGTEGGKKVLRLGRSVWIRAASGKRPVILLKQPLAFRPHDVTGPNADLMDSLTVKLEGLYISRHSSFSGTAALIERAALNKLIVSGCTLDPGGYMPLMGPRTAIRNAMQLDNDYGFVAGAEHDAFDQKPEIVVERTICGPLSIDTDYTLSLIGSIVDGGSGLEDTTPDFAVCAATGNPLTEWGPDLIVSGLTCFGKMRVETATGQGGIWVHKLEVHDNQKGCIKFSYFSGENDRLPQNHGCVFGTDARLSFVSEFFGEAGYAQLDLNSDSRILEHGPNYDEMGAFGYLLNSHKWKNINIRYREFMPVSVKPVLIPVT
jgi:hypothetical protein